MERKKVALKVESVMRVEQSRSHMALVLREEDGDRKLVFLIGASEANVILMRLNHQFAPRPLTTDLMMGTWQMFRIKLEEVLITRINRGIYYVSLFMHQGGEDTYSIDARPSDAIAVALAHQVPIYIWDDLLEAEQWDMERQIVHRDTGHGDMPLQVQLEQAIKEENYELAALLRDKIKAERHKNIED